MQLRQPFKGYYAISLDFGEIYPPYYTKENPHKGIDYLCPKDTPILASADGWVLKVGFENGGYGNYVLLLHSDNTGTVYAHLNKVATYMSAQVKKGDVIGYSGSTGNSTGPHLHFEYRKSAPSHSTAIDPKPYMQSVSDYVPPVVTETEQQEKYPQRIDGGLCEVICDKANIRDSETFIVKGQLFMGAKVVVSPDIVRYNELPYHKINDDYMLIAEYDGYGNDILRQIDK